MEEAGPAVDLEEAAPPGGDVEESRENNAQSTATDADTAAAAVAAQAAKLRQYETSAADDRAGSDDGSKPSDAASAASSISSLGPEPTPGLHDPPEPSRPPHPPPAPSLGVGAHRIAGMNATNPISSAAEIPSDSAGVATPAAARAAADAAGGDDEGVQEVHAYPVEETPDLPVAEVEEMRPWLRRREGKLAALAVGLLLAALVVILGVFLTRPDPPARPGTGLEEVTSDAPTVSPTLDPRPLLTVVRERGSVRCGVEDTVATGAVNFGKFAADLCRGVAVAVLGDPDATRLVPVGEDRYQVLNDHGVDLLVAGDAWTVEKTFREVRALLPTMLTTCLNFVNLFNFPLFQKPSTGSAFNFGYPYYFAAVVYVGVPNYVQCAMSAKRYDDCSGLAICAVNSVDIRDLMTSLCEFYPSLGHRPRISILTQDLSQSPSRSSNLTPSR